MSEQIIAQKGLRSNQQLIMKYPLGIETLGSFRPIFQKIQNKPMKTMVYLFARAKKGFGMSALDAPSSSNFARGIPRQLSSSSVSMQTTAGLLAFSWPPTNDELSDQVSARTLSRDRRGLKLRLWRPV